MGVERDEAVVILGAGLAGLSAAFHLRQAGASFGLYEREGVVGGLCRSMRRDGFTFDCTGHLMHFRRPEIKALAERLMREAGSELVAHQRRAAIFSHGVFTDYPFQANTFGLPIDVVKECLMGFIEAWGRRQQPASGRRAEPRHFGEWVLRTFGAGIAKHFMTPFNEKLWQRPLSQLGCDWGGGWLIPVPSLEEVVQGALGLANRNMGYNPSFYYPKEGGIQRYPDAFARQITTGLHLKHELTSIDLGRRVVEFQTGERVRYRHLISTLPVPELVRRAEDVPAAVRRQMAGLAHVSVTNVNLGVDRRTIVPYHWIYFPEPRFPFYRVGFPSNLSPSVAPPGQTLISVECSHRPDRAVTPDEAIEQTVSGLRQAGLLRADDRITMREVVEIPYAYVIFDRARSRILTGLSRMLRQAGVRSIGRYGAWEHSSMEDAVRQGKEAAEAILGPARSGGSGRARRTGRGSKAARSR
ncbi:MAG: FAD-dependent oxidoreductase [Nitrospirae bacterium]|nr:FAD-dependent oxidoreductase [Nitrospirota bacterium]